MRPTCTCLRHTGRAWLRCRRAGTSCGRRWAGASGACEARQAVTHEISSDQSTPHLIKAWNRAVVVAAIHIAVAELEPGLARILRFQRAGVGGDVVAGTKRIELFQSCGRAPAGLRSV